MNCRNRRAVQIRLSFSDFPGTAALAIVRQLFDQFVDYRGDQRLGAPSRSQRNSTWTRIGGDVADGQVVRRPATARCRWKWKVYSLSIPACPARSPEGSLLARALRSPGEDDRRRALGLGLTAVSFSPCVRVRVVAGIDEVVVEIVPGLEGDADTPGEIVDDCPGPCGRLRCR